MFGVLADDFHADGALSGNHGGVVEGGDVGKAALGDEAHGVVVGVVIGGAVEDDFAAARFNRVHFDLRGGFGHDDGGFAAEFLRREGDALGVVARAGGDHAAFELRFAQRGHFVVRAAYFKGENGLQILAFEQDVVFQTA